MHILRTSDIKPKRQEIYFRRQDYSVQSVGTQLAQTFAFSLYFTLNLFLVYFWSLIYKTKRVVEPRQGVQRVGTQVSHRNKQCVLSKDK